MCIPAAWYRSLNWYSQSHDFLQRKKTKRTTQLLRLSTHAAILINKHVLTFLTWAEPCSSVDIVINQYKISVKKTSFFLSSEGRGRMINSSDWILNYILYSAAVVVDVSNKTNFICSISLWLCSQTLIPSHPPLHDPWEQTLPLRLSLVLSNWSHPLMREHPSLYCMLLLSGRRGVHIKGRATVSETTGFAHTCMQG